MKSIIMSFASMLLFLLGCADSANKTDETVKDSMVEGAHKHDEESTVIELNNGEKWLVDSNMMIHFRKMESDVAALSSPSQEAYQILAENLTITIDTLTSNCTMKGKAHDELHKWLLPFIDLVDEFGEASTAEESREKYNAIKSAFVAFNEYFQ